MQTDRSLRAALLGNAAFSATCAAAMMLAPSTVVELLGITAPPWLVQLIGAGLVLFAADLVHQATRQRMASWRALYASAADFLWVIGTFIAIAVFPNALSGTGLATVLIVAAVVAGFGAMQLIAIDHLHRNPDNGMHRHCLLVRAQAPADAIWNVLRRLGDVARYMPALRHSELLDGQPPGLGAVRRCEDHRGRSWSEACTAFSDAGRSFVVRFLTDEPGFPFPARSMLGGWEVTHIDEQTAEVMVWWELQPSHRMLAPLMLPLLAWQADRDFPQVIGRMADEACGRDRSVETTPAGRRQRSALLALRPC